MPIVKSFAVKEMEQLQPGELFVCEHAGLTLAIAAQTVSNGELLSMVVLKSDLITKHPCHSLKQIDGSVISYGTDWVLDLGLAEGCYPGNMEQMDLAGTVIVTEADTILRVDSDRSSHQVRPATFDLNKFIQKPRTADPCSAVFIRNWCIWLNESERTREGGTPLFVFDDIVQQAAPSSVIGSY